MSDLFKYTYKCIGCEIIIVTNVGKSEPLCFTCSDNIPDYIPKEQYRKYLKQEKFRYTTWHIIST